MQNNDDTAFHRPPASIDLPEAATPWQLARCAVNPDAWVRAAVARHEKSNKETLLFLTHDSNPYVREAVAKRHGAPCQALMWLAEDTSPYVREAVAQNVRTPSDALDRLVFDENSFVRSAAVLHPGTRVAALVSVARMGLVSVEQFLKRDNLPLEVLAAYAEREDDPERLFDIARDTRIPLSVARITFSKLPTPVLEKIVEERADIRDELLKLLGPRLARAGFFTTTFLKDPNTPPETLAAMARNGNTRLQHALIQHPNTPTDVLVHLAKRPDLARLILERQELDPEIVNALAEHNEPGINLRLARHASTPPSVLEVVVRRGDLNVAVFAANNPATPSNLLRELSRNPCVGLRKAVANNPSTPIKVLERLCDDPMRGVSTAAQHAYNKRLKTAER